jgi:hypothetical protein
MADIREHFNWSASKERRQAATDKLELFDGRHMATLHKLIRSRMNQKAAAEQVIKWSTSSRNVLRQFTRTIAVAYSRGCVRQLAGASPATAAAFAAVLAESKIASVAPRINQYAFVLGPTLVIPQVELDGTFYLDLVPPSASDMKRKNPQTPLDVLYQRTDGMFIRWTTDDVSFFNSDGEAMKGVAPVWHGLGYVPISIWRSEHWSGDWWNQHSHRALVDASYDVAHLEALMKWKRKNGGRQPVVYASKKTAGAGQVIGHPELPLWFDGPPEAAKVEVIDLDSPADTYLNLINATIVGVCELYGLPPSVISGVNGNADWGQVGMARAPEVLDALRDEQIPYMEDGERQLWAATCDLLRASSHKHAKALPPGDEVRDMLTLRYLEPIPDMDRRLKRLDVLEREMALGLADVTDIYMENRPSATFEEAQAVITANEDRHLARIDKLTARNIPAGRGPAIESVAQAQGRLGGLTSAATKIDETTE